MKNQFALGLMAILLLASCATSKNSTSGWVSIFDGKTFNGWKVNEHPETFSIQDGSIVANGERAHLFYTGPLADHDFKNFEFKAQVKTMPNSNSGIYFHTMYQDEGWPSKGYEVQVNNSHSDWRRTGGLYAIDDVKEAPAKDNVWFTEHIIVNGKHVQVLIDGKKVVDYTEPENPERPEGMKDRLISDGTFALQGHDPGSKVFFKDIMVKVLPD
ncbi:MAG: DUF1080 domain-containing protein [Saprospiraceae bacterium]|nr:DUF1080 domain-containing protein [Lewinella sp.]